MLNSHFIYVALAITVFGNLFYIRDTLKGITKPNRVTFFLWSFVPLVAFISQRSEHAGIQSLYTLIISVMTFIIFASSFINEKAYWKITRFDIGCGLISLIALVFLLLTGNGTVALALSIVADFFAALPTIIKSYKYPHTETVLAYASETISSVIVLLTIHHWVFVNYIFSAYILFMCAMFTTLLTFPRSQKNQLL